MNLLTEGNVKLTLAGDVDQDAAERFARLFRAVWSAMPAWDRRQILGCWQRTGGPEIMLVRGIVERRRLFRHDEESEKNNFNVGVTSLDGSRLAYDADFISILPDEPAQALIAHELGHCLALIRGLDNGDGDEKGEQLAYTAAKSWGFPIDTLNDYENSPECREAWKRMQEGWEEEERGELARYDSMTAEELIAMLAGESR